MRVASSLFSLLRKSFEVVCACGSRLSVSSRSKLLVEKTTDIFFWNQNSSSSTHHRITLNRQHHHQVWLVKYILCIFLCIEETLGYHVLLHPELGRWRFVLSRSFIYWLDCPWHPSPERWSWIRTRSTVYLLAPPLISNDLSSILLDSANLTPPPLILYHDLIIRFDQQTDFHHLTR